MDLHNWLHGNPFLLVISKLEPRFPLRDSGNEQVAPTVTTVVFLVLFEAGFQRTELRILLTPQLQKAFELAGSQSAGSAFTFDTVPAIGPFHAVCLFEVRRSTALAWAYNPIPR